VYLRIVNITLEVNISYRLGLCNIYIIQIQLIQSRTNIKEVAPLIGIFRNISEAQPLTFYFWFKNDARTT